MSTAWQTDVPGADTAREAARQQALLAALWSPAPADVTAPAHRASTPADRGAAGTDPDADAIAVSRGLQAYRGNAWAIAERALAAAYPTVQAMLGAEDFLHLAREHWLACPPRSGDLADWGADLPGHLAAHPQLGDWPWLPDTARLDWAVHQAERAADSETDGASLMRMGDEDPDALRLLLAPGLSVLTSPYPLHDLHRAHHAPDLGEAERQVLFASLRAALHQAMQAAARGPAAAEHAGVVVARLGWKARVHPVTAPEAAFMRQLQAGACLGPAVQTPGLDFSAWLAQALQSGWLQGVQSADPPPS